MQKKIIQRIAVIACLLCLVMGYIATPLSGQDIPKAQAATMLARTNITIKQRTATTVTLSIRKVSGAQGYQVYRATLGSGKYEQVANTTATTYKDTKRKSSVSYCYKVRPYKTVKGKKVYGSCSNVACATATLKKTENVKVTTETNGNKISWSKVSGASKYNVYRSASKNGEYKYIGCSSTVSYTDKTADQSKVYYYKVRAYSGCYFVNYYGVYSDIVASTVKEADTNDGKKEDSNKDQ
uniref:fibronectin type III domain-containing protein n=1 Tax=Anaerosporobacter sp. TaxID=1872529 RepID=UPI002F3EF0EA